MDTMNDYGEYSRVCALRNRISEAAGISWQYATDKMRKKGIRFRKVAVSCHAGDGSRIRAIMLVPEATEEECMAALAFRAAGSDDFMTRDKMAERYGLTKPQINNLLAGLNIKVAERYWNAAYYRLTPELVSALEEAGRTKCVSLKGMAKARGTVFRRKDDRMFSNDIRGLLNPAFVRWHDFLKAHAGGRIMLRHGMCVIREVYDLFFKVACPDGFERDVPIRDMLAPDELEDGAPGAGGAVFGACADAD